MICRSLRDSREGVDIFAIFKDDRVTQLRYRPTQIGGVRRLRTKAELLQATSCGPQETQWRASPRRLRVFLSGVRATLSKWRQRKNGRLELARLDERMLGDIGLTFADADYEINKPFWRE
jgi:uncharacterized protein YjiS (DUF1127 family)